MNPKTIDIGRDPLHAGDLSRAAAIGAFGRLCGDAYCAGLCRASIVVAIAAGNAAGRVHKNDFLRWTVALRQQGLGRAALIQPDKPVMMKADVGLAARSLERDRKMTVTIHHNSSNLGIAGRDSKRLFDPALPRITR